MSCHEQFQQILTFYTKVKKDTTQDKKATTQAKRTFEGQKGQNEANQDKRAERAPILALSFLEDLSRVQSCEGLPRIVSDFYGL